MTASPSDAQEGALYAVSDGGSFTSSHDHTTHRVTSRRHPSGAHGIQLLSPPNSPPDWLHFSDTGQTDRLRPKADVKRWSWV